MSSHTCSIARLCIASLTNASKNRVRTAKRASFSGGFVMISRILSSHTCRAKTLAYWSSKYVLFCSVTAALYAAILPADATMNCLFTAVRTLWLSLRLQAYMHVSSTCKHFLLRCVRPSLQAEMIPADTTMACPLTAFRALKSLSLKL